MKNLTLTLATLAFATVGFAGQHGKASTKRVQKATVVVDNGFKPSTISATAGQPMQITFDVKHKACISSVVFDGMKLDKPLTDGKKTVVTLTPKKGTTAFHCPMNMMKGKVIAK